MRWDPAAYARYADERSRPFHDLVTRIQADAPRHVVDLGCGPGTLTATLAQRWPAARILGIDSSPQMIERAEPLSTGRVGFEVGDIDDFSPGPDVDVVISNAALQWVPAHRSLLSRWARELRPGAWLAFQVPDNFGAPSHALMRRVAESARWRDRLDGVLRHTDAVAAPRDYADLLLSAGWVVDAWRTTYLHVLPGTDPVLAWVRGTGLRPILDALPPDEVPEFEQEYAALLREAYPPGPGGTILPFDRIFVVAHRPA